ncbi:hypothetical protein GTO10_02410 [Candidatus Saccharibacteria bacterium]|nr:hypothetical protein [Candidatus Saccharibacteria bacterium]
MPSKYVVRNFRENAYYHVFNRGVEKRDIFLDEYDYHLFQRYLFLYLRPIEEVLERDPELPLRLVGKNLTDEVELLAYCLMPNHFHLLLKQRTKNGISKLLKQLTNAYTLHFNEKYERVGGLMQGRYKAVEIKNDNLFIHLARYIHLNPVIASVAPKPEEHPWSSYQDYLGQEAEVPVEKDKILSYFPSVGAFKGFHEDQADYKKGLRKIEHLAIDAE